MRSSADRGAPAPPDVTPARRILDLVAELVLACLALLAVLVTWSGARWGVALAAVALVGLAAYLWRLRSEGEATGRPLGEVLVVRTATVAAVAVGVAAARPGQASAVPAALGAALLLGAAATEPLLGRVARFTVPAVTGLPGVPARRDDRDLTPYAVGASLTACLVGLVVTLSHGSAWWWCAAALLAVVPTGLLALQGRSKVLRARRLRVTVPAAVARYAPEFVVYTSRPDEASHQVTMWLPYLKRSGKRFVIVTRHSVPALALAKLTDVPVIEARAMADLDALVVGSLRAAFYVNASSGNGVLVRFQHLRHVYLGHGDSDKPPSYNPTHAMYDEIFAAGPAAVRRYAAHGVRIPAEKFRIVGRPQVEGVRPATGPISAVAEPVVLYAPTWRGHVAETMLYSLPNGERIVAALLARGATVIFRPHPFSADFADDAATMARIHALLAADARASGRAHVFGASAETERGILDCINDSDAMVSDVSSVVSDYLFSGKPFAMVAVPAEPAAFVAEFPVARASYVIRGDLADLDAQLDAMLGEDLLAAQRAAVGTDYLGDFPAERYADAFVSAVRAASEPIEDPGHDRERLEAAEEAPRSADGATAGADDSEPRDPRVRTRRSGPGRRAVLRLLAEAGLDLGSTAIALLALGAALLHSPGWLVLLLAVAALLLMVAPAADAVRARRQWPLLLGLGEVTRTVLVAALAVAVPTTAGRWWFGLGCLLLVAAVAVEQHVDAAWRAPGLTVRHLPQALPPPVERVPRGLLPLLHGTAVGLGFLAAALGSPVLILGLGVVVALAAVQASAQAMARARQAQRAEEGLRQALEAYAPEFVAYFASTVGVRYQLGMWLPYFVRIGRPFLIVTRALVMQEQVADLCDELGVRVPILYRPTLRSVEEMIVPTLTTAYYVNNAPRNTHLVERRELTHVWLNHGDSEKPACYNPVHAIYDLLFVAGQAGIDRYARHGVSIPAEKFQIVGRPQVEQIARARAPIDTIAEPTVLYAPTWQGPFTDSRVYSLPLGRQIVTELLRHGCRVVFRAHPFNYRYPECETMIASIGALLDADRARTGRQHLWGAAAEQQLSIEDCFNLSDAMVSDVSAVVSDYLQADKPFAMVSVGRSPDQLVVEAPAARAAYVLREDLSNLAQVCEELLHSDPMAAVRRETKIYYLGDFPDENYAEGFLDAARAVIAAGAHRYAASTAD